jgi:hypothetical protein
MYNNSISLALNTSQFGLERLPCGAIAGVDARNVHARQRNFSGGDPHDCSFDLSRTARGEEQEADTNAHRA